MNNKKYANSYYEFRRIRDLRELIFTSCELYGDEVAYLEKNKFRKVFEGITYKEVKKHVIALGNAFANMGLVGEKIAIAGETSYSWILTYFATVCGVGTVVPLDKNLPTEELINLINRSKSSCLAYGKKIEGELEEILAKCPAVKHLIRLDAYNKLEGGEDARHGEVQEVSNQSIWWLVREGEELVGRQGNALENLDIDPDNMAVLMFTSGTTGRAKGVMLSQRNIAFNVYAMSKNFQIPKNGVVLSILPIHHAYEMTCDIWTTFYQGKTIAICEGIKYIQKNMQEVKANVMLGVPLVFEKMYKGMWKQAEKRGEAEKLRRAIALSKKLKLYNNPKVIKKLFKAVHQNFGGEMKKMVSGGAAIDPRVIEDFEAMGLPMIQGYGMSEHAPIIAVNQDRYSKAASVGRPMEGVSVKIVNRDEDGVGEIICKSPSVMLGYYEDEEATSKVLDAGWLKTGDLGYMDEEGFLYITGRKKNVIVTKGGKNIFPEELEALLQENPYVVEAVVLGIRDEKVGNVIITADIYPNYQSLAEEEGLTESSEIYHYFKDQVEEINKSLSPYKAIKRINVRKEEFVKTTTGKIKRYEVEKEATTTETKESGRVSYQEVKAAERRRANEFVRFLNESKDPYVRHKFSRPITDLKDMLESSAKLYGENVAFRQKFSRNEPYKEITYKEALGDVNGLGTALINRGLKGKRVAIVGNTCYQWESSYLAVVNGVGVVVPLDKELSIKELEGLIKEAEVSAIICQSKFVDDLVAISKKDDNQLEFVIDFGDNKKKVNADSNEYLNWDKLIKEGKEEIGQGDRQYLDAEILGDEMSILLFTSGTTGMAKAVMLSHYNIAYDLMSAPTILHVNTWDIFFSVLPVHHTYECTAAFLMPLYKGASIAFCQGLKYLSKNLEEVKPTMLLGVPALFEALYKKIWKGIDANGKGNLLRKILRVNRITTKAKIDISRPFVKEIKKALGGRMRVVISGGAAIRPEILDFFNDIGIIAVQGYGLTECAPMVALNPDRRDLMRNASVGHVLPGMEARIVDATKEGIGEICFKGDNIMLGYYNKPKATAEVLKNGWFHTGDLGYIDKDDFVYITGRKKNVIITKNGENVYPEEIEFLVSQIPIVDEVMVWGDVEGSQDAQSEQSENQGAGHCAAQSKTTNSNTIVATITLDKEVADEKLGPGYSLEDAEKVLWQEIDLINDILPFYKKIKKIHIKEDGFEKTSGKKIKRFVESNK